MDNTKWHHYPTKFDYSGSCWFARQVLTVTVARIKDLNWPVICTILAMFGLWTLIAFGVHSLISRF